MRSAEGAAPKHPALSRMHLLCGDGQIAEKGDGQKNAQRVDT